MVRPLEEQMHINLSPADPGRKVAAGVTCCLARPRAGGDMMLLTAKHVVEGLLPSQIVGREWVPIVNAKGDYFPGRVYAKPPGVLDAVLIEPTPAIASNDPNFTPFKPPAVVTAGDAVELQLRSQPKTAAKVVETNPLANVPFSKTPPNLQASQIIVDQYGSAGDSGSLIIDKATGDGVALYRGSVKVGKTIRGAGQYLGQVAEAMDVELLME